MVWCVVVLCCAVLCCAVLCEGFRECRERVEAGGKRDGGQRDGILLKNPE